MNTVFTDYTEQSTFSVGYGQQSRIVKYVRDLLNNWFADSRNIKDQRILSLMYDKEGNLSRNCIKLSTPFNPSKIYAGTTPAILVSLAEITYSGRYINNPGNPYFADNPMQSPVAHHRFKNIPINITVLTQNHDGTVLLAQLIQMFLVVNSYSILQDCNSLRFFQVQSISAPTEVGEGQAGNAKKLYSSTISILTQSALVWSSDTQGPVFRGLKTTSNFK